jgi:hypothetical protein
MCLEDSSSNHKSVRKGLRAMGESHSMMLVKRATETCEQYLDAQAKGEIPTLSALLEGQIRGKSQIEPASPEGHTVSVAHALNRFLERMNLHVTRASVHSEAMRRCDEAVHSMRRCYVPVYKRVALGTMVELEADPSGFDAAYDALSDNGSRQIFDWFVSYRWHSHSLGRVQTMLCRAG